MTSIELLAPAKDLETGIAAINCGADAVYLGAAHFGARQAAGNTIETITALANYAHKYWAKVYVTLNTLLYDDELSSARALAHQVYEAGVDALIIQDAGLLELDLPPLPLFASTQMHNHTPERVAFLEKVGFQRVILARELNIDQIRTIRASTSIELECFIHGALCVSYSGQCYLSYALGGRSGNRGQCAQPCRRQYRLTDAAGCVVETDRHWLCLRDLNLSADLPELLSAGVHSFKIEGRLKDKAYVMNIVGYYRQRFDQLLSGQQRPASSGKVLFDFTPDPLKTFNRGFTSYYLHGRSDQVASPTTPKSLGEPLGRIKQITGRGFILDSQIQVSPGDGFCFFASDGQLQGSLINDVQGQQIIPAQKEQLVAGLQVFRNHDHTFITHLNKSQTERKIRLDLSLSETVSGFALQGRDEDGICAQVEIEASKTPAEKPELALETIHKQLTKTGGTEFQVAEVEIQFERVYFLPVQALNHLRRQMIDELVKARQSKRPRRLGGAIVNHEPYPVRQLSFQGNVLNQAAVAFYRRHGVADIEPAAESGSNMKGRRVMTTRYCIKWELGACPKQPGSRSFAEPLALFDEQGNRFGLQFLCGRCEMEVFY